MQILSGPPTATAAAAAAAPPSSSSSSSSSSCASSASTDTGAAAAAAATARGVRTPGERLGAASAFAAWGRGTYERDGYVYAAAVGVEHREPPSSAAAAAPQSATAQSAAASSFSAVRGDYADVQEVVTALLREEAQQLPRVSVVPLRQRRAVLPVVGSIVLAQVTKVSLLRVECSILVVENQAVPDPFKGVIRAQDIRETDVDSVDIFESYQPADILRARVISVADPRCYLLSTAGVHLGVLYAQGKEGGQLRPVTRRLMRCDLTGALHRRKVAVPLPPQSKS